MNPYVASRVGALCAVALAACSPGSSLLLEVTTTAAGEVEQLQVTGRESGALVFGPAVRPERPAGPLRDVESVRILLVDELAGRDVQIAVEGLRGGDPVAIAEATARPVRGDEVRLPLSLVPGGLLCGACEGCCERGVCVTASVNACGAGGTACFACDPVLADNCSDAGRCQCGDRPSCAPERGSDQCVAGQCRCGAGAPCAPGTRCDNGVCRCTADSCAGCCADNECLPGTSDSACGESGAACAVCDASAHCTGGACGPG